MRHTNEIFNNLDHVDISEFKRYFKIKFNIPESAWEFLKAIEAAGIKQIHKNAFDAIRKFLKELNKTQRKIPQDFLAKYLKEYFDISAELQQLIATVGGTWLTHGGATRAFVNFILNGVKEVPSDIDLFVVVSQDNLDKPIGKISFGELKQITKRLYVFECKDKKYEISYLPEENKKNMTVIEICKKSAKTRDTKGNALFIELENGELLDFLQGILDIRDKKQCLIEEIHTALGFEESDIPQRALKILRVFRILSLQTNLKDSHNQLWQGFNKQEAAHIKKYASLFATLKDDGRIRNTLPKFFTKGYGYAVLKKLDNLRILKHFFPYYASVHNLIFSIQYHIDQAFRKNKTIINSASLYALLYWPSFCYEYLFVINQSEAAAPAADIAEKVLLFNTSDPQVKTPLKFTKDQIEEITALWERAATNLGFENIKDFLHFTKSEEEAASITEKIFQFLYTASSHKVLDLSHSKIDENIEIKIDNQQTIPSKEDSSDVQDTASKKLSFPKKKKSRGIIKEKRIFPTESSDDKKSLPHPPRKYSIEPPDAKNEITFVTKEENKKIPPAAPVLRKNGTKKLTKAFRFLNFQKLKNEQLPLPQDLYAAIMKKINNNKFEHPALTENDKQNLRAAQQRRTSKHRFFSTSYSSGPHSSLAEVGQSFFRPIYFLMALSIAVFTQTYTRFYNETNPYEFYLKENEGKDLLSSFVIIFGFMGLWDCMIASRALKNEQVNFAQIWEKLQHYPDNQIAVNHATLNNKSRANNSTAMLITLSFICAAFGGSSNARSIACYYLALVLVSMGAEIRETVTPAPATNSTSNLSR